MENLKTKLTGTELFAALLIMVYCFNVLNKGYYVVFIIIPFLVFLAFKNKIKIDMQLSTLIIFSILYSIILNNYGFRESNILFLNLIGPVIFYLFGHQIITRHNPKKVLKILLLVAASLSLFGFLNVLNSRGVSFDWRAVVSIWGGSITATGANTYLSLGLSLLPLVLLSKNKNIKIISLLVFGISVYSLFSLANRTGVLIILLSIIFTFLFIGNLTIRKLFMGITLFLSSFLIYQFIITTILGERLSRGNILSDPRFEAWNASINGLGDYPFGGKLTNLPLSYVHNMWLDVGHEAGIIPLVLLSVFTILAIKKLATLLRSDLSTDIKIIFLSFFVAFFVTFSLEPIMEGWYYYFNVFCFVFGMLSREISNIPKVSVEASVSFSSYRNKYLKAALFSWSIAIVFIMTFIIIF